MNLVDFKDHVEPLALAVDGINAFKHGWVHEVNGEVGMEHPYLLMTPPFQLPKDKSDDWSSTYECKFYLVHENQSNGQSMTPSERDVAWSTLQAIEKLLRKAIESDTNLDLIRRPGKIKFNEGYLTNSDPIWMEFDYEIRAKSC